MNKSAVLFALCFLVGGGVGFGQFFGAGYPYYPGYPGYYPGYDQGNQGPNIQINNNPAAAASPEHPYARLGQGLSGASLADPNFQYYTDRDSKPMFYKPTMRYYGNGYTVSYRYVPVYRANLSASLLAGESSNFATDPFRLSPEQVAMWGAGLARVTVKDNSSNGPRTAVTSIVHKKTTTRTSTRGKSKDTGAGDGTPAIQPGTAPAPVPAPESSTPPAPKQ
jgi:hypothetical protein